MRIASLAPGILHQPGRQREVGGRQRIARPQMGEQGIGHLAVAVQRHLGVGPALLGCAGFLLLACAVAAAFHLRHLAAHLGHRDPQLARRRGKAPLLRHADKFTDPFPAEHYYLCVKVI